MSRSRPILSLVLVLGGLVWIGQGLGFLRGSSFMVDDVRWAVAGVACVVAGAGLLVAGLMRPRA